MDSGYYAAYAGYMARTQALDAAADNLANAQTVGYRAERENFRSALLDPLNGNSQLGTTVNNYGVVHGDQLDMSQGALTATGNPLDLAIQGEGFFATQTPSGVRYTRNGGFHRSNTGVLVNGSGDPVLSTQNKPIVIPPGEVAVGDDGVLSVDGGAVAVVGVFQFPKGTQLTPEGTNRYRAPDKVKTTLASAQIHSHALEESNQDTITGSMKLILMQRQAETMQKALTIFHMDFNKTAAEELPRV